MKAILKSFTDGLITAIMAVYLYAVYFWFRNEQLPVDVVVYLLATYTVWRTVRAYLTLYREKKTDDLSIIAEAAYNNYKMAMRNFDRVAYQYIKEIYDWHIKPRWKRGKTSTSFTPSELSSEIYDIYFQDLPDNLIKNKLERLGYTVTIEKPTVAELQETYGDRLPTLVSDNTEEYQAYLCTHSKWTISWNKPSLKKD